MYYNVEEWQEKHQELLWLARSILRTEVGSNMTEEQSREAELLLDEFALQGEEPDRCWEIIERLAEHEMRRTIGSIALLDEYNTYHYN